MFTRKRNLIIPIVVLALLTSLAIGCPTPRVVNLVPPPEAQLAPAVEPLIGPVINFPDPNLEALIRWALEEPYRDIHRSDMERFIKLSAGYGFEKYVDAPGGGITDLSGLEHAVNLEYLVLGLGGNQIRDMDISPLANLVNLRRLSLGARNQIRDISPLANLIKLEGLFLSGTQIRDISPLANLVNLTDLGLSFNQIRDISPLANLVNLSELNLRSNQVRDISPLANLTNLRTLWLCGNQIRDISPLANLINLRTLWLGSNEVSDISPLSNLTNLWTLDLDYNQITDISPLSNLNNLWMLHLRHNRISDISPLLAIEWLLELDSIALEGNPLSADSINIYIPQLETKVETVSWR